MLEYYLDRAQSRGQALFYGVTLGGGVVLLVLTTWLWWHFMYLNPQNVYWAAVKNNLVTSGVTKQTVSAVNSQKLDQYEQITLGSQNFVKTFATITQTEEPKSTVVTETLGTPQANFARYTKIETSQKSKDGQAADFKPVLNVWSKTELGGSASGMFATAIFDALPFAHLNGVQTKQVMHDIKNDQVYDVDFAKVSKERKDGRLYYTYNVGITSDKYIALLKKLDGMMGLNQLKELDPTQYQGGAPIQVKVTVDAVAHQLASLTYVDNNRTSNYSAYGVQRSFELPTKTISQEDLQAKLSGLLKEN
ncbi:MAG: hypothetical protein ABIQ89_04020 [Candidatus Saccharimonadales bacterium]